MACDRSAITKAAWARIKAGEGYIYAAELRVAA